MYQIPQHILDGLRCHLCSGYLSIKPILVRQENQQVCAKCYKTLPVEEREKCYRQIGLENLAVLLNFPCRYNISGCSFTFKFNDKNRHEEECQYRYRSLKNKSQRTVSEAILCDSVCDIKYESEEISAALSYEINEDKYSNDLQNLTYNLDIRGKGENALILRCANSYNDIRPIRLCLEGSILLGSKPEPVFTNIKLVPTDSGENLYETLQRELFLDTFCVNCKLKITNKLHNCTLGHHLCDNCKHQTCVMCTSVQETELSLLSQVYGNNNSQGSNQNINSQCPFDTCLVRIDFVDLHQHLIGEHSDSVYSAHEITRTFSQKDDNLVLLCYDSLFKVMYYYYKTFVEFFVTYIGTADEAKKFIYEITATTTDGTITRKAPCCNWNDQMLERGVSFDKKDLVSRTKKFTFEIKLKIIK